MRIGFDIDGVLADFNTSFIERVIAVTGRDLFPPRPFDIPCWDYPEFYGYTHKETSKVWQQITSDPTFWLNLNPYPGADMVIDELRIMSTEHDIYFVTSRPGIKAKQQTEVWLSTHSGDFLWTPTILIASEKDMIARALDFDAYIDDRWENCIDVACEHRKCQTFLLDRPWNSPSPSRSRLERNIQRVFSPVDMLDAIMPLHPAQRAAA